MNSASTTSREAGVALPILLAVAVLAVALVACGSDDAGTPTTTDPSGTDAPPTSDPDATSVRSETDTDPPSGPSGGETTSPPAGPPSLVFDPADEDFFALPIPSDARRDGDGRIRFSEWTGLLGITLTRLWVEAADDLVEGWGVTSGFHAFFDAPIDASTLPERLTGSLWEQGEDAPSVFLIDVDPDSPERGRTFPLEFDVRNIPSVLTPGNRLAAITPFGVTRRPLTQYAFVVTTALAPEDGGTFVPSDAMRSLLAGDDVASWRAGQVSGAPYAEAASFLAEQGLPTDEIVGLVLFTTADPSARLRMLADWAETLPTPTLGEDGFEVIEELDVFTVLAGRHSAPQVQEGTRPFASPPAGRILFGEDGLPVVVEEQWARFNVSLPPGPMPEGGWPVLLYMHGSGSNWMESIVRGNPFTEPDIGFGTARVAAEAGWATVGFDFPLHGDRSDPPDTTGLRLYNLTENPRAAVDNFLMAAVEMALRTRFLIDLEIDPDVAPGRLDAGDAADGMIRFNPERIAAFGQSMGSTLAVPWATIDDNVGALFLHGSGGVLVEIGVTAVQPFALRGVLELALGYVLARPQEELTRFDPVLHWLQHYWDIVDPIAHARHVIREPHEGRTPTHVYQHSGLDDGYFSVRARTALGAALGLDALGPTIEPWLTNTLAFVGRGTVTAPVSANLAGESTTGVLVEWCPWDTRRGHYIAFDLDNARAHLADAMRAFADTGMLTVGEREDFSTDCPQADLSE